MREWGNVLRIRHKFNRIQFQLIYPLACFYHHADMPLKNTFYIEPMLATLVDKPFDEPGWVYEIKWDGYRAISYIKNGKVDIRSRNNKSFNEKFYPVYDALLKWKTDAIVDGEIIVVNQKG